ncbi:SAV_915 family protein [Bounagaea algeriensis]
MQERDGAAPSVIGADYVAEINDEPAELVYVPCERVLRGDTEVTVELRRLEDGRTAVVAYTSLDSLVQNCGDLQPWASLPSDKVQEIQERSGADVVLWDVALPADQRNDSEGVTEQ